MNIITDDLGYNWRWNEEIEKIYCLDAQNELSEKYIANPTVENYEELNENGYYAHSWGEAVLLLMQFGYIDIDPYKIEPTPQM